MSKDARSVASMGHSLSTTAAPVRQPPAVKDAEEVVKTITTIINTRINVCISGVQAAQAINVRCNPTPDLVSAFQNSQGCIDCQAQYNSQLAKNINCPQCYACVATDLSQTLILTYDPNVCVPFGPDTVSISKNVTTDIKSQITRNNTFLDAHPNWIPPGVNRAVFLAQVEQMVTNEDITAVLLTMRFSQSINFDSTGGSVQSGVTQKILAFQASDMVSRKLQTLGVTNTANLANVKYSQQNDNANKTQAAQQYVLYFTVGVVLLLLIVTVVFVFQPKKVVTPAVSVVLPTPPPHSLKPKQRPPQAVLAE
jgi:hypothetical protein